MEQIEKDVELGVGLREIELLGLEITEHSRGLKSQPQYDSYEFGFEMGPLTDMENEKLIMLLKVSILDKETRKVYGVFNSQFTFDVKGLAKVSPTKDGVTSVEIGFLRILAGVCVSTARGMFFMASANTKISNALMPIIDPNTFFTEESQKKVQLEDFSPKFRERSKRK